MSESKRQSLIITGIGLIIIAGIILYFALSQPRVYVDSAASSESVTVRQEAAQLGEESTAAPASSSSVSAGAAGESSSGSVSYPVNINSCSAEELIAINGIGESRAGAIIEYREYIGGYTSVEQIKNIKGIGESLYEKISPYMCV